MLTCERLFWCKIKILCLREKMIIKYAAIFFYEFYYLEYFPDEKKKERKKANKNKITRRRN